LHLRYRVLEAQECARIDVLYYWWMCGKFSRYGPQ
jgi:hypothetical protein